MRKINVWAPRAGQTVTMKQFLAPLVAGFSLFAIGCAEAGDALNGRALAEGQCARCHAVAAEGTSPYPGAQPFRNLLARWKEDDLARALETGILASDPAAGVLHEMKLSGDEIADLLAYLRTLKAPKQNL